MKTCRSFSLTHIMIHSSPCHRLQGQIYSLNDSISDILHSSAYVTDDPLIHKFIFHSYMDIDDYLMEFQNRMNNLPGLSSQQVNKVQGAASGSC